MRRPSRGGSGLRSIAYGGYALIVTDAGPTHLRVEGVNKLELLARRHWWVLPLLAITVIGTHFRGGPEHGPAPGLGAVILAAVAVLALLVRWERPELTVVANGVAVTAYFAFDFPDGPVYLSILLSTYALAFRRPLRAALPFVGVALVAILLARSSRELAGGGDFNTLQATGWVTWLIAIDGASVAIGMAMRNRRVTREEQARRTATEEQLRMAQDLHDGVGHGLAVIAMQAGVALHVLDQDPAKARESLLAIRETSKESLDALRTELMRLAPRDGAAAPLAPRNGIGDLPVLVDRVRAGGLEVELTGDAGAVTEAVDAIAYVVVQESLTNVLRHADASHARVVLTRTGEGLQVTVTDDGRGATQPGTGMGIPGLRSRVALIGGRLETGPAPGGGFVVQAFLPIDDEVSL